MPRLSSASTARRYTLEVLLLSFKVGPLTGSERDNDDEQVAPYPHDWPRDLIKVTGYWLEQNTDYEPSAVRVTHRCCRMCAYVGPVILTSHAQELEAFLSESEDKPVYMGFGSMPVRDVMVSALLP
jgi:hypothetical protein